MFLAVEGGPYTIQRSPNKRITSNAFVQEDYLFLMPFKIQTTLTHP